MVFSTNPPKPRWYLIQRYYEVFRPTASGVYKYLRGDYMGAAEFEFGAVPEAWDALYKCASMGLLVRKTTDWLLETGRPVHVIVPKCLDWHEVQSNIFEVASGKKTLKEGSYMEPWMRPLSLSDSRPSSYRCTTAWLLLSAYLPIFWCVHDHTATAVFKTLHGMAAPGNARLGVRGEDLRMFEERTFEKDGVVMTGVVRGILEFDAVIVHSGTRHRVPFSAIHSTHNDLNDKIQNN